MKPKRTKHSPVDFIPASGRKMSIKHPERLGSKPEREDNWVIGVACGLIMGMVIGLLVGHHL